MKHNLLCSTAFTVSLILLSACGGSGSTSAPPTPTPTPMTNSAPIVASSNSDQSARVGVTFSYDATQSGAAFTDSDGDTLSYTVSYSPAAQGLSDSGGTISGTPSQEGTVTIDITANDGNGGQVSDTFDILIAPAITASDKPNIVFVLVDDQGKESSAEYALSSDLPVTPNFTAFANNGVIFENVWVSPSCSPTRAALLTGKHNGRTNVLQPGDNLAETENILQNFLKTNAATSDYTSAMIGKWHLGGGQTGPNDFGIDYYAGIISGSLGNYFNWDLNVNGTTTTSTTYATTELTNLAVNWVDTQAGPWFLWLSYNAPHTPYHLPPTTLHDRSLSGTDADINANTRDYYLAAIEAMDSEFGRFWESLETQEQDNTIVIYLGDNGTPGGAVTTSASQSGNKGGLLQGGINTPFFISGAGITRAGEREDALVSHTDIFATIAELAGADLPAYNDGRSFADLLSNQNAPTRDYVFTEFSNGWAIRNDQYKLIEASNGSQTLYDLLNDPAELTDMLAGAGDVNAIVTELETEANNIRNGQNITGVKFSNPSPLCSDYVGQYTAAAMDVLRGTSFDAVLEITATQDSCTFVSNSIPNHDFNDGDQSFANAVGFVTETFSIPIAPTLAQETTPLDRIDNAIMLNGVKVDILSAGCFGVGDERTGCTDPAEPWRFDPMHAPNGFQVDNNNAHAQPDGAYHYHGPPPISTGGENTASGLIGYAADGFPIYGPYLNDNGAIRTATSSFQLKSGTRPSGAGEPGGTYDGQFRADYEYVSGIGDLDECNGMTLDGQYRYHVTAEFPYLISCFSGAPDPSFFK